MDENEKKLNYTIQLPQKIVNRLHCVKKLKKGQIDMGKEIIPFINEFLKKIEKISKINDETWKDMKKCPKCESYLIRRKGKNSDFYGCYSFPLCTHTEKISK